MGSIIIQILNTTIMRNFLQFTRIGIVFVLLVATILPTTAQTTRRVTMSGAATGTDGSSWAQAMSLQAALAAGNTPGDQIWIAAGTYRPGVADDGNDATDERAATFTIQAGVLVYGGFAGTEAALADRAGGATILLGDLAGDDIARPVATASQTAYNNSRDDNSYTVVTIGGTNVTLNGLTIEGGERGTEIRNSLGTSHHGAGLYVGAGTTDITLMACTFNNNNSTDGGGGGAYFTERATLADCTFTENTASGSFSGGGGAYFEETATLTNCTFTENTKSGSFSNGGGVHFNRMATLTNCVFADNNATLGGGAYFNSTAMLTGCDFTENTAGGGFSEGGGAFFMGTATVTSCTFTENTSSGFFSGNGGGVLFNETSRLTNCTFTDNEATSRGGGAYFDEAGTVINSTLYNNMVGDQGGGIFARFETNNPFTLQNSILVGNTASDAASGHQVRVENTDVNTVNVQHNLIAGGADPLGTDQGIVYAIPGSENITEANTVDETDAAMVFASIVAENANYLRLVAGSPAVNAGNNLYLNNGTPGNTADDIKTDAAGNARIQNRRVDLGAYESTLDAPPTQAITFADPTGGVAVKVVGETLNLVATTNALDLFVTFTTNPPGIARLLDDGTGDGMGRLRFTAVGVVTVTAVQTGGDSEGVTYPPAISVTHTITVRPAGATIFRVTTTGAGNRSGSSWANAMTLQAALGIAIVAGDQIWIAAGTYTPHADDRTATFTIPAGVLVYGGFDPVSDASDTDASSRSGTATILSGDLADNDLTDREDANYTLRRTENSNTVVAIGGANVTLNGLTIEGGERGTEVINFGTSRHHGAGLYTRAGTTGITITVCTFNNNSADEDGGGAYFTESATLTDCTFNNNNARDDGGGAYFTESATLTDCTFNNNNARDDGGGAYFNGTTATVTNCIFTANTTNGSFSDGGGAYFDRTAIVIQCTFTDNETTNDGGGAYFDGVGTVINSTLYNNSADDDGGGLYVTNFGFPFTLQNSILMGNTARNATSGHQTYVNNTSTAHVVNIQHNLIAGGADPMGTDQGVVYRNPSFANVMEARTVDESDATAVFASIMAENANYLRLVAGSPAVNAGNNLYLNNGTPDDTNDDIKTDAAGNVRIQNRRVDLGAYESTLDAPVTQSIVFVDPTGGATVKVVGETLDLVATTNAPGLFVTFTTNPSRIAALLDDGTGDGMGRLRFDAVGEVTVTAVQAGGDSEGVTYPPATSVTHTITVRPATATIFRVTTTGAGNRSGSSWANAMTLQVALGAAIVAGDQIWIAAGTYKPDETDRTATFTIPAGVLVYGGFEGDEITFTPDDPLTPENEDTRDRNAEGVLMHVTILSGDLADNDLTDREDANYTFFRNDNSYSVVIVGGADVTLDGLTIEGGERGAEIISFGTTSRHHGAGLYAGAGTTGITLMACIFNNNSADDDGGGAYFRESAMLTDCTFNNNSVDDDGGGAFFRGTATVTNCTFTENTANGTFSRGSGGAFFHGTATVTNCIFTENTASTFFRGGGGGAGFNGGGGAYFSGTATVTNCTFTANTANGGIYSNGGGGAYFSGTATVTNCIFTDNETRKDGGGAYFSGTATVTNCTFTANTTNRGSSNGGGGAYFSGTATVTNCTFTDNETREDGGGAYFRAGTVINSTFYNNRADRQGGGLFVRFNTNNPFTLQNSILLGNTATDAASGHQGRIENGNVANVVTLQTNLIAGGADPLGTDQGIVYTTPGSANVTEAGTVDETDAAMVFESIMAENANYLRLAAGSPAVNAGNNAYIPAGIATDVVDNARIQGGTVDLGAYERAAAPTAQVITFDDPTGGAVVRVGQSIGLMATTDAPSDAMLAITFTSSATNIAVVENDGDGAFSLRFNGVGDVTITATQAGDTGANGVNYARATATQTITVEAALPTAQIITFDDPTGGATVKVGQSIGLVATTNAPNDAMLAITFTSSATDIAVVENDGDGTFSLRLDGIGDVTITATQAGGIGANGVTYVRATATQTITVSAPTIRRVTTTGDAGNDGSNWTNAMTLQAALMASTMAGDQVWIAAGTYKPHADDRTATFTIPAGVLVYGGFDPVADATDTDASSRSGAATILSGDLADNDASRTRTDNSRTVVTIGGADVTLDGLTIEAGEDGTRSFGDNVGAGLFAGAGTAGAKLTACTFNNNNATLYGGGAYFTESVTLTDCTFKNNSVDDDGGGAFFNGTTATLTNCIFTANTTNGSFSDGGGAYFRAIATLTNCTFTANTTNGSFSDGGGAYFDRAAIVTQCTFTDNETTDDGGGAYFDRTAIVTQCTFTDNETTDDGGGAYFGGVGTVINSTLYNNSADDEGGGLYVTDFGFPFTLQNSILVGNTAQNAASGHQVRVLNFRTADVVNIQHNLIAGGVTGATPGIMYATRGSANIMEAGTVDESDASVIFVSTAAKDANYYLRLEAGSPAVNAGNNDYLNNGTPDDTDDDIKTDLAGEMRIQGGTVDLGAYEGGIVAPAGLNICRVTTTGAGTRDGRSWANASQLRAALAASTRAGNEIWIAAGTYKPDETDRTATFTIPAGVLVYGGFEGDENTFTPDDPLTPENEDTRDRNAEGALMHVTILSGDLADNDLTDREDANYTLRRTDNSHTVVTIGGADVTLDGLTIEAGEGETSSNGGGLYAGAGTTGIMLAACTFNNNSARSDGGGAYFRESTMLTDCTFTKNTANGNFSDGGGAYFRGTATVTNCTFTANTTNGGSSDGGGAYFGRTAIVTQCTFTDNETTDDGGGAFFDGVGTVINSTLYNNSADDDGGGLYVRGFPFTLQNSILVGNTAQNAAFGHQVRVLNFRTANVVNIQHNLIAGGADPLGTDQGVTYLIPGSANITEAGTVDETDATVVFVSTAVKDANYYLRLVAGSPAVNAGNNLYLNNGTPGNTDDDIKTDLAGEMRIQGGTVDLGAYEGGIVAPAELNICRVTTTGAGTRDGRSWANASQLRAALATSTRAGNEIWIAAGTYKPNETNQNATFTIPAGVLVYGGFEGDENTFTPDDPLTPENEDTRDRNAEGALMHVTTLSGDLADNDLTDRGNANYTLFRNDNSYSVVTVGSADVTLDGLTIEGGERGAEVRDLFETHYNGAGLYAGAGTTGITITACTFNNNNADDNGGGAYFTESATLTDCTFNNNNARDDGGGAYFNGTTATLTNCVFTDNNAVDNGGGAYFNATAMLTGCDFNNNNTRDDGGGAFFNGTTATVTNCTFTENTANGSFSDGGGAFFRGTATVTQCTFTDNETTNDGGGAYFERVGTMINSTLYNNSADDQGGGLYVTIFPFTLQNSILVGNTARNAASGHQVHVFNTRTAHVVTIQHNLIAGGATGVGAGIKYRDATSVNVTEVGTVDESDATVVFVSIVAANVNYLRLVAGSPAVNAGNNDYLNNGTPDNTGDDIMTDAAGNARIQSSRVDLGAYESAFDPPAMQTITFADPTGGVAVKVVGETLDLVATTNAPDLFVTFTTDPPGIAALLDDGAGDGIGMLRFDAIGEVTVTAVQAGGDSGGVTYPPATSVTHTITVRPATATIFRVTTTGAGNRSGSSWTNAMTLQAALGIAIVAGDQIWIAAGTYKPHADDRTATFSVSEGVLVYGGFDGTEVALADRAGGATILSGDLADNDLTDRENANYTLFRNDNSHTVVTVGGADVTLDGLIIEGGERGTEVINFGTSHHGAGLYAGTGTTGTTLTACTFNNNSADDDGGGAYFTESATLTDCTFNNNSVNDDGGGAYFNRVPTLTNCVFVDNNARDDGGGAYFDGAATLMGCNFNDNNSDYWGGGALFRGTATVTNCTFAENTANGGPSDGGGAYFSGTATVTNCTFTDNETTNEGGGAYFRTVGTVINSTLYNNTADNQGGGIFVSFETNNPFTLQNSILVGNTTAVATSGHQTYVNNTDATDEVNIQHNLIAGGADPLGTDQGVVYRTSGSANITEANTVDESDATVVFASIMAANPNYLRLVAGSLAVNAGNNLYLNNGTPGNTDDDIKTDLAGEMRIQGGTVDLGAYEGAFVAPTAQVITFTDPTRGATVRVGQSIDLVATTNAPDGAMLAITFTSSATGIAVVENDGSGTFSLRFDAAGDVTITATQAGGIGVDGVNYARATATQTITVMAALPTAQVITFDDPTGGATVRVGQSIDLVATTDAPSDAMLAITFTSSATNIAVVENDGGGTFSLRFDGAGDVTITATQAGGIGADGVTYAMATATQTITVEAALSTAQVITFDDPTGGATARVGQSIDLVATTDAPDGAMLAITFTSSATNIAVVENDGSGTFSLRFDAAGDVTITATQAGGIGADGVNYAMTTATQTITVEDALSTAQVITFDDPTRGATVRVGQSIDLVATTDAPDGAMLAITFTSSATNIAVVENDGDGTFSLRFDAAGDVTITATQAGGIGADGVNYAMATATQTITVEAALSTAQVITFDDPTGGATARVGQSIDLVATTDAPSDAMLAITFTSSATNIAVVENDGSGTFSLRFDGAGDVTITATQAGGVGADGVTYARATATQIITVEAALPVGTTIRRVTTTGTGDGSSWVQAMTLQAALMASTTAGDQVWIAAGRYKPHADDRTATFTIPEGVLVYGGFDPVADASDTDASSRSGAATILSGDLLSDDIARPEATEDQTTYNASRDDNSYTVVTVSGADVVLDGLTISGGERGTEEDNFGSTEYHGAGLYGGFGAGGLTLQNVIIRSNNAEHEGGGAYFKRTVSVKNTTFTNNTATEDGGGAYFNWITTITGSTFSNNRTFDGSGGGAYFGSVNITDPNISSVATVTNSTFTNNSVSDGRANGGGGAYFDGSSTVTGCTFSNNTVTGTFTSGGGGAHFEDDANVVNCVFVNNSIAGSGGGAYFINDANVVNSVFVNNNSDGNGGGAYFSHLSLSSIDINRAVTNSTFYNNNSGNQGGGVYVHYFFFATLNANNFNLRNSILMNNRANVGADELYISTQSATHTASIDNNLIQGGNNEPRVLVVTNDGVSISNIVDVSDATVVFASTDAAEDDYLRLVAGSPAVGAGDNNYIPAGITTDAAGEMRIQGGTVDLGAYESGIATPVALNIRRVTPTGTGDGSSWANASQLKVALAASNEAGNQIWIAEGTYKPNADDRATTFTIPGGVLVYGGFDPVADATDTDASSRSGAATILSGDLLGDDIARPEATEDQTTYNASRDDNSYTVVTVSGADVVLDGLTISGGERGTEEASFSSTEYHGAGLYGGSGAVDLTLQNITLRSNNAEHGGGGAYFERIVSVTNSTFRDNTATGIFTSGGGGAHFDGSATVTGCTFRDNIVKGTFTNGGGAYFDDDAKVVNCIFANNSVDASGGGCLLR